MTPSVSLPAKNMTDAPTVEAGASVDIHVKWAAQIADQSIIDPYRSQNGGGVTPRVRR
jgi:hypothetical protein